MNPEEIATSWRYVRIRLHRLTSIPVLLVPALLVCCAVILNVGPFGKPLQRRTVVAVAPPSSAQLITQRWLDPAMTDQVQADAGIQPDASRSPDPAPVVSVASAASEPPPERPAQEEANGQNGATVAVRPAEPRTQPVQLVTTPMANAPIAEAAAEHEIEPATPAGIWAPNATACSLRDLRDGLLPTIIDAEGARAGDTYCTFRNRKQIDAGWQVVASCADAREHWTALVHLTVQDGHLTWASSRGRQVYTRCAPDAVKTAAR